ncbi:MAG: two pore domain potassium channel family protein [Phycicoccus sp.]|nr:two pore domain potassium channel family protein [Phycicoccus sp.]
MTNAGEPGSEPLRDRWEDAAEWPLTGAAVLFLVAYAWPILAPDLAPPWPEVFRLTTWGTWGLFVVDYVVRLALSRSRWEFVRRNLLDLAVVALPLLRPLRLLRLVTLLSVLNRYAGGSLRGRVAVYVAGSVVLVLFVASLAVLDAERGQVGANISTFGDALWWAMTTVTTVGYGDRFPVTETGRLIAGGLMLAGVALLGVVTASLASWLLERVREVEEDSGAATRRDVAALTHEVAALREDLARDRASR